MSSTVSSMARATEQRMQHNTVWGVREPLSTRPRPHLPAAHYQDAYRSGAGRQCSGPILARSRTSSFLQMKDPDTMYPSLFSEDSTSSTKQKMKIIRKTRDVLRATQKGADHQRRDARAGAGRQTRTVTHASSARTPPDTLCAEPTDVELGHQDTSVRTDQETHVEVPAETVLPTPAPAAQTELLAPAPAASQQPRSSSLPGTITGKLYWAAGALFGTLEGFSKLLI